MPPQHQVVNLLKATGLSSNTPTLSTLVALPQAARQATTLKSQTVSSCALAAQLPFSMSSSSTGVLPTSAEAADWQSAACQGKNSCSAQHRAAVLQAPQHWAPTAGWCSRRSKGGEQCALSHPLQTAASKLNFCCQWFLDHSPRPSKVRFQSLSTKKP